MTEIPQNAIYQSDQIQSIPFCYACPKCLSPFGFQFPHRRFPFLSTAVYLQHNNSIIPGPLPLLVMKGSAKHFIGNFKFVNGRFYWCRCKKLSAANASELLSFKLLLSEQFELSTSETDHFSCQRDKELKIKLFIGISTWVRVKL